MLYTIESWWHLIQCTRKKHGCDYDTNMTVDVKVTVANVK